MVFLFNHGKHRIKGIWRGASMEATKFHQSCQKNVGLPSDWRFKSLT